MNYRTSTGTAALGAGLLLLFLQLVQLAWIGLLAWWVADHTLALAQGTSDPMNHLFFLIITGFLLARQLMKGLVSNLQALRS